MPFSHPAENEDSAFERFAEAASNFTTRWLFFALMLLVAIGWGWAAVTEHSRWEHIFTGVFAIVTLFKVSLLANSERRNEAEMLDHLRCLREKLDDE
jgi:low affinity Fe/Cu permease